MWVSLSHIGNSFIALDCEKFSAGLYFISAINYMPFGVSLVIGVERFGLPTSCSQSKRSSKLNYTPLVT